MRDEETVLTMRRLMARGCDVRALREAMLFGWK